MSLLKCSIWAIICSLAISSKFINADDADFIESLPGVEFQPTFKHYSGFLNGSETHLLHYW